jgi:hypothetical protein
MSDHLIAEANRHAMTLPTTHPTHADIAWYVREVDQLSAEVKSLREWQQEVIQNAWAHKATVETAIARAERAEAELSSAKAILASIEEDGTEEHNAAVSLRQELAAERARLDWLNENAGDIHRYNSNRYIFIFNQDLRAAIDAAMKEGA